MNQRKIILIITLLSLLTSCAKQSTPMGGPRDEKPPILIESNPINQSIKTTPDEIILIFDEYVKLENPTKGIVITPRLETDKIEFISLKNTVKVKLNQELENNTTYVFDFQKAVVDITEENPAENLKLVFSTGSTIDSLQIKGNVNFYYPKPNQDNEDVLIGLYPINDTTDLFTGQPYYLGRVDSIGNFIIDNIKGGDYRIYAYNDLNGNLKADYKSEDWDFLLDTIHIEKKIENVQFNLSPADLTPIKILRSSSFGKNYDIILNRNPIFDSIYTDTTKISYKYLVSNKRIRIYSDNIKTDSIPFQINLQDSVGNKIDTLIWAKFKDSDRKPEPLTIVTNSGKNFYKELEVDIKFNKPVKTINTDSLFVQYDTAGIIPITQDDFFFLDSTKKANLRIKLFVPDSLSQTMFILNITDSTFYDVEGLINIEKVQAKFRKIQRSELADKIAGPIQGAEPPFIIQLIDTKNQVTQELIVEHEKDYSFQLIEPGNYKIRVIEDNNGNKRWDSNNIKERRNAERVFYYRGGEPETDQITIRAGWTLEDLTIKASNKTGIKTNEDLVNNNK